jgi:hypothetical protein
MKAELICKAIQAIYRTSKLTKQEKITISAILRKAVNDE